jgi:hypothetical protein
VGGQGARAIGVGKHLGELEAVEGITPVGSGFENRELEWDECSRLPAHPRSVASPAETDYIFLFMETDAALPGGRSSEGATARVARALIFALVGVVFFAHWAITDPSLEESGGQDEWGQVLAFSAILLSLAVALPVYGLMVGGRWVIRLSALAGVGALVASVANIFEDGFQIDAFFFGFVLGTGIADLALPALALVIACKERGHRRLLVLVPLGSMAGVILYVWAGGPIMLVTWLAAALVALVLPAEDLG